MKVIVFTDNGSLQSTDFKSSPSKNHSEFKGKETQ